jgi:hypothetical protein
LMLEYGTIQRGLRPVKKFPYAASGPEWAYLATLMQELEPTNMSRKNITRGPDWIKMQWEEVRKISTKCSFSRIVQVSMMPTWMNGALIR